jgi:tetratricopeptide (TPR) repeat protein
LKFSAWLLLCVSAVAGAPSPDPPLSRGFEHFYNLEFPQAVADFRAEVAKTPADPEAWNHLAQGLLYSEMYNAGALESELVSGSNPFVRREKMQPSPAVAKEFDHAISQAMSLGQAMLAKNPRDIRALYALGVAHGLRANYNYLVRKAWLDSLKDSTQARKYHNQIGELDPNNIDCRLVQGLYDYIVGSLPWHMKMLGFIAGHRGDREAGMKTIRLVAAEGHTNRYDARLLLAAIYRRERRPLDALPLLRSLSARFPRNFLFRLEMVQMYSDAGNKDAAVQVLDKLDAEKKANDPALAHLPAEKIAYYRGNLLFWYRDYAGGIQALRRATKDASEMDLHSATMSWLRLGQCHDMLGQRQAAAAAYRQAVAIGPQTDPGKEAKDYVRSPYKRPSNL